MTITVIHEVRWLPNDIAERLQRIEDKLDHAIKAWEGGIQQQLDTLTSQLNQVATEEEEALNQSDNLKEK